MTHLKEIFEIYIFLFDISHCILKSNKKTIILYQKIVLIMSEKISKISVKIASGLSDWATCTIGLHQRL